jgi:tetratricopeptide (TPR) repeat protein
MVGSICFDLGKIFTGNPAIEDSHSEKEAGMLKRQLLNLLAALAVIVLTPSLTALSAPPTQKELSQAIERLGDPRFDQRRKATDVLWAAGIEARPLLEAATKSKNAEVRFRARAVLEQFKYGIFATTPAEDVALIRRFREGDVKEQADALKKLADRGTIVAVLRLLAIDANRQLQASVRPKLVGYLEQFGETWDMVRLATEAPTETLRKDIIRIVLTRYEKKENFGAIVRLGTQHESPEVRRVIRTWIEQSSPRFMPVLMDQGEFATVERLLELGAVGDLGMRHLAVYALFRGDLEERIQEIRRQDASSDAEEVGRTRLLAYMLRANGDLAKARSVAERLGDDGTELTRTLLYELADWPAAILFDQTHPRPGDVQWAKPESLGFQAAFQRLAGDEAAFQQTMSELAELGKKNLQLSPACAKIMLIHGETARAIELKQVESPLEAFTLLCRQFRYADAFRLAKIGDTEEERGAWFTQVAHDVRTHAHLSQQRLNIGLYTARMLANVGHRGEAQEAFEKLGKALRTDGFVSRIRTLCEAELKSGFNDLAFQHATMIVGKDRSILSTVFPRHHETADTLWDYFRHVDGNETYATTLGRIRKLLYRTQSQTESPIDLAMLVGNLESNVANLSHAKRARWLYGAGRTSALWGRRDLAKRCFEQAADGHADAAFGYADQFAAEKKWSEAVQWYRKCWELDHRRSGAIFLQGRMLTNAGQENEGRRLMDLARLMPLADSKNRYQRLAEPLKSHRLMDDAVAQWTVIVQQGDWSEEDVLSAVRDLGNIAEEHDLLAAADYWEKMLLACLQVKFGFTQTEGYIHIPHLIQKTRAKALLTAGQVDAAIPIIQLAHSICPGDGEFIETVVPELEKSGRPELADQLFDRTYKIMAESCQLFTYSARARNDLAWMSARCNRRLDEALQFARRAIELSPKTASYIDTLGEVHFRRGEVAEAIECGERCLEIEPDNEGYQKQLDRFRASQ